MLEEHRPSEITSSTGVPLEDQVAHDLEKYLDFFPNRTYAIRNLSKESGLNEKTLRRLLKKENLPSNQTLFKLYYIFTKAENERELLESCPPIVKERLKDFELDSFEKVNSKDFDFLEAINLDPIMGELYLLLGTTEVEISHILYHYGQYGVRALEKLEKYGLAIKCNTNLYTLSKKQPYLSADILKTLGLRMTSTFMKAEDAAIEGKNFIGLYAESLNNEGKKKWLEIDQRAFNEKVALAKDKKYQGNEPVFTFQATDDFKQPTRELQ